MLLIGRKPGNKMNEGEKWRLRFLCIWKSYFRLLLCLYRLSRHKFDASIHRLLHTGTYICQRVATSLYFPFYIAASILYKMAELLHKLIIGSTSIMVDHSIQKKSTVMWAPLSLSRTVISVNAAVLPT